MPPRKRNQAVFANQRLATYLKRLLRQKNVTFSQIAILAEVSESRVSQWFSGKRGMMPETAFNLGEQFRRNGWRTSGIELLWAMGCWSEILDVIKILSLGSSISECALKLYCWLPGRMLKFERELISDRLRGKFEIQMSMLEAFENIWNFEISDILESEESAASIDPDGRRLSAFIRNDPGAREFCGYFPEQASYPVDEPRWSELDSECCDDAFHSAIWLAWKQCVLPAASRAKAKFGATGTSNLLELHLIDGVIEAARRIEGHIFPSFAIPKIWRICAGWFYEIGNSGPSYYFPALPENFLTIADGLVLKHEDEQAAMADQKARNSTIAKFSAN